MLTDGVQNTKITRPNNTEHFHAVPYCTVCRIPERFWGLRHSEESGTAGGEVPILGVLRVREDLSPRLQDTHTAILLRGNGTSCHTAAQHDGLQVRVCAVWSAVLCRDL
jgi:hypothetical protein